MRRQRTGGAVLVAALCLGLGCKKPAETTTGAAATAGGGGGTTQPANSLVPARGVGMDDPFARLNSETAKALNAGYKSLKAKKYDDAKSNFNVVVMGLPDYTPARWQEVRAVALGGHFDDVPALWGELLARDFVAYAGRFDKAKEFAPLRASPAWAKVQAVEAAVKPAYVAGLDKGLFFVARSHDAGAPKWKGDEAKLSLSQEVYHFDPATQRYRRMTDTDGTVFAINVSPGRKLLSFLTAGKILKQDSEGGPVTAFEDPKGGVVDLATLSTTGPFKIEGGWAQVTLAWTTAGEPAWVGYHFEDMRTFNFDAAKTALVESSYDPKTTPTDQHATAADPNSVAHSGAPMSGAKLSDDKMSVLVDGYDKPLRAAHELEQASLEWSPGKKLLAYAGTIDPCKVLKAQKGEKLDKNELFLWDAGAKQASRVAAALSTFDTFWLDDDHLVYEGGFGKDGKLHVYQISTRADTVLKPHYGAGLYGLPERSCEEPAETQPEMEEPTGDDGNASAADDSSGDAPPAK